MDVLNLVSANAAAREEDDSVAPLAAALTRQQTLAPLDINGKPCIEIELLGHNASSFTSVHLVAAQRDNRAVDQFAHGRRPLRAYKKIVYVSSTATKDAAHRELQIYQALSDRDDAESHVIKLVEYEEKVGALVLLMEYGGGGTLENWHPKFEAELVSTCTTMLRCLAWLHDARVVHLDIKPANFVFASSRLKLIDFGVARQLGTRDEISLDARLAGTMDYIAPEALGEQDAGPWKVSTKTDMWAFGCVVCKIVTDKTPFPPSESRSAVDEQRAQLKNWKAHLDTTDERLGQVTTPGVSGVGQELIHACCCYAPGDRPTAKELLESPVMAPRSTAHLSAAPPPAPILRRSGSIKVAKTVDSVGVLDVLFIIFAYEDSPWRIFTARRVCKASAEIPPRYRHRDHSPRYMVCVLGVEGSHRSGEAALRRVARLCRGVPSVAVAARHRRRRRREVPLERHPHSVYAHESRCWRVDHGKHAVDHGKHARQGAFFSHRHNA